MAVGMACSDRRRHSWMVDRDGLGRRRNRSMASGLVEETLGCLHRCAKHQAPKGKVDFNCRQHLGDFLRVVGLKSPMAADGAVMRPVCRSNLPEW
jgi:hypothetical protein